MICATENIGDNSIGKPRALKRMMIDHEQQADNADNDTGYPDNPLLKKKYSARSKAAKNSAQRGSSCKIYRVEKPPCSTGRPR